MQGAAAVERKGGGRGLAAGTRPGWRKRVASRRAGKPREPGNQRTTRPPGPPSAAIIRATLGVATLDQPSLAPRQPTCSSTRPTSPEAHTMTVGVIGMAAQHKRAAISAKTRAALVALRPSPP